MRRVEVIEAEAGFSALLAAEVFEPFWAEADEIDLVAPLDAPLDAPAERGAGL